MSDIPTGSSQPLPTTPRAGGWDIPMAIDYSCVVEELDGVPVLRLSGDMGMRQSGEIERSLLGPAAVHPQAVVVDLSGVTFIASIAIGSLMAFQRGIVSRGGRVYYAAPSKVVADVLRHAHLDKVMKITASVEEAVEQALGTEH